MQSEENQLEEADDPASATPRAGTAHSGTAGIVSQPKRISTLPVALSCTTLRVAGQKKIVSACRFRSISRRSAGRRP